MLLQDGEFVCGGVECGIYVKKIVWKKNHTGAISYSKRRVGTNAYTLYKDKNLATPVVICVNGG